MLSERSILTAPCPRLVKKLQTGAQLTAREGGQREDGCRSTAPHAAARPPQPGAAARPLSLPAQPPPSPPSPRRAGARGCCRCLQPPPAAPAPAASLPAWWPPSWPRRAQPLPERPAAAGSSAPCGTAPLKQPNARNWRSSRRAGSAWHEKAPGRNPGAPVFTFSSG